MMLRADEYRQYASFAPGWWMRLAAPPRTMIVAGIAEREWLRKSIILGVVLFFTLLLSLPLLGEYALSHSFLTIVVSVFIGTVFIAAQFNRRGYLQAATFFYLLTFTGTVVWGIWSNLPGSPFAILWEWALLLIPPLVAGLFLPFWTPFVFALMNTGIITYLFLRKQAMTPLLAHIGVASEIDFLLYGLIMMMAVAVLSAVYAYSVTRAISEADRAAELEAAHIELQATHTELAQAYITLEELATHDPLTGLVNHRTMNEQISIELQRAERSQTSLALIFLDIDHFKALNDTYGHPVGDHVLKHFATTIASQLRSIDIIGRWGGEEFVGLLPDIDAAGAQGVAERIRAAVASQSFSSAGGIQVTCSIGLAFFPRHATTSERLLSQADHAMYAAKKLGRNQVRVADELAVLALETHDEAATSREEQALLGVVEALGAAIGARDAYTAEHMHAVGQLASRIALQLGLSHTECRAIEFAARLHDIGKIAIPDAILCKHSALTPDEIATMRNHPVIGAEIISHIPALRGMGAIIRAHHERWNGTGYPDGLVGEAIPLGARIIAVADAFDAMVSTRPYHVGETAAQALAEVERCADQQFDPAVVAAFSAIAPTLQLPKMHRAA
ncbi:MAG: diguanylate cyclase [Ktedonobacterales bacterium]|nr:diguanylate cyclase [Ktedonobacterales bacterium]